MISQLRLDLPNEPGKLAGALRALAAAGVDLKALEVNEGGGGPGRGQAHVVVADPARAQAALVAAGYACALVPAVVAEVPDRVGGLLELLDVLARREVNVLHLYAFVTRVEGKSLCVFTVDEPAKAEALLREAGHRPLDKTALDGTPAPDLGAHLGVDYFW